MPVTGGLVVSGVTFGGLTVLNYHDAVKFTTNAFEDFLGERR